jgi:hypothetical protein
VDALAWVVWAASSVGFVALFVFYLRVARRQLRGAKSRAGYAEVKSAETGLTLAERLTTLRALAKGRPLQDERLSAAARARAGFQIKMMSEPAAHWYRDVWFLLAAQFLLLGVGGRALGVSDSALLAVVAGCVALEGFVLQSAARRSAAHGAEWLRQYGGAVGFE